MAILFPFNGEPFGDDIFDDDDDDLYQSCNHKALESLKKGIMLYIEDLMKQNNETTTMKNLKFIREKVLSIFKNLQLFLENNAYLLCDHCCATSRFYSVSPPVIIDRLLRKIGKPIDKKWDKKIRDHIENCCQQWSLEEFISQFDDCEIGCYVREMFDAFEFI
jgi:hypothetical protein